MKIELTGKDLVFACVAIGLLVFCLVLQFRINDLKLQNQVLVNAQNIQAMATVLNRAQTPQQPPVIQAPQQQPAQTPEKQ